MSRVGEMTKDQNTLELQLGLHLLGISRVGEVTTDRDVNRWQVSDRLSSLEPVATWPGR